MAFEARKPGGTVYFYSSVRDSRTGRVRKVYVGTGPRAAAAAAAVEARRQQRAAERRAGERLRAELAAADALAADLDAAATLLMEAALLAAGFHRRNYGAWRHKRGHGSSGADTGRPG